MWLNFQIFAVFLDISLLLFSNEFLLASKADQILRYHHHSPESSFPFSWNKTISFMRIGAIPTYLMLCLQKLFQSAPHHVLNEYLLKGLMTSSCMISKPFVTIYVTKLVTQVQVCPTRMGGWGQREPEFYSLSRA